MCIHHRRPPHSGAAFLHFSDEILDRCFFFGVFLSDLAKRWSDGALVNFMTGHAITFLHPISAAVIISSFWLWRELIWKTLEVRCGAGDLISFQKNVVV